MSHTPVCLVLFCGISTVMVKTHLGNGGAACNAQCIESRTGSAILYTGSYEKKIKIKDLLLGTYSFSFVVWFLLMCESFKFKVLLKSFKYLIPTHFDLSLISAQLHMQGNVLQKFYRSSLLKSISVLFSTQ